MLCSSDVVEIHATGAVLSSAFAVNVVFCVSVTDVVALLALAGLFPLFVVQLENAYHTLVSAVALIFTVFPYLYVQAHVTFVIPVHLFNVSVYVSLSYQHAYVVFDAFAVTTFVAAVVDGFHTLVIFRVLGVVGCVHRLDNVKLVPLGII